MGVGLICVLMEDVAAVARRRERQGSGAEESCLLKLAC
jgi:hypothetical protein